MSYSPAYSMTLDVGMLAASLWIQPDEVVAAFRDGRVSSRFAEYWACSMFKIRKHSNTNNPTSDAYYQYSDGERFEVAIRTLTSRGIRFQDSRFMGTGRSCSLINLKESIRRADRWIVFNVSQFPEIVALRLKSAVLEKWIDNEELTPSGLSLSRFASLMARDAKPQLRQLEF